MGEPANATFAELLANPRRNRLSFSVQWGPPKRIEPVPELLAGAAEVDITPPPGMPKAGYSANAHDGNGFRTRLRARILHLRANTTSIVIVQCDLLGGSSVLQHLVGRELSRHTDLDLSGVFIGATHTHAGPGQFLGTDFYNRFASNRAGFDSAWAHFLCHRIALGAQRAVRERRPARLAVGSAPIWGYTRNRSHRAHVANETIEDKRTEPQRKFTAINPTLHMIRVDTDAGPLAVAMLFSVHGTGISMKARGYNADVWAYMTGTLANRIESTTGTRPVVGAMQASHADVAPAIRPKCAGYLEARRVGSGIGEEALSLWSDLGEDLSSSVELAAAFREVDLSRHASIDGITLPSRPAVGAALVAGAKENFTPFINRIPPFRAGFPRPHRLDDPQGAKWVLGSRWLQPLVLARSSFPRVIPFHLLQVSDLAILGLPFEVTVEAGRRISQRVLDSWQGSKVTRATVSSVANEYAGYLTTAEEYGLQFYEGGHTLYGPNSCAFIEAHAERLAMDLGKALVDGRSVLQEPIPARHFDLAVRRYLAQGSPEPSSLPRRFLRKPFFVDPSGKEDGYWQADWIDAAPGDLDWHEPLVRIEARDAGGAWRQARRHGTLVDDQGWDIEVSWVGPDPVGGPGAHAYRARWYDPELRADRAHRFVLVANAGRDTVASAPFD